MPMYDEADPNVSMKLSLHVDTKLVELRASESIDVVSLKDTRPTHQFLFEDVVKPEFSHYVGTYRGTGQLINKQVCFGFPPSEGSKPDKVLEDIDRLKMIINSGVRMIKSSGVSDREATRMNYAVLAAKVVAFFIKIHPYVDGNGHISRFLAVAILVPLGYTPNEWTIHPRPGSNSYERSMIEAVSTGNLDKMVNFFIKDFVDTSQSGS